MRILGYLIRGLDRAVLPITDAALLTALAVQLEATPEHGRLVLAGGAR